VHVGLVEFTPRKPNKVWAIVGEPAHSVGSGIVMSAGRATTVNAPNWSPRGQTIAVVWLRHVLYGHPTSCVPIK
jgi:hypothetical protein